MLNSVKHCLVIDDLITFVLDNRTGDAFKGWTTEQLKTGFFHAINNGELLYSINRFGWPTGIVMFKVHPISRIHITNILCTNKDSFRYFVDSFNRIFPGREITGNRKGKLKLYNTKRLCHLVSTLV